MGWLRVREFGIVEVMEEQRNEPPAIVTLSDDDIAVEVKRETAPLSASHAAQLGKIGPELSGQNQQNFQNN
jgi:hypothetical protein